MPDVTRTGNVTKENIYGVQTKIVCVTVRIILTIKSVFQVSKAYRVCILALSRMPLNKRSLQIKLIDR